MVGYVWRGYITTNYRRCSGETTGNESNAINASWLTGPDLHHLSQIEMRATKLRSIRRNRFWINSILMTFVNML